MDGSVLMDYNVICIGQREKTSFCSKFQSVNRLYLEFPFLEYIRGMKYQYLFDYDEQINLIGDSYSYFCCKRENEREFIKESIRFYLQKSPIHKIVVLFRLQLDREERITGEISFKQFMKKLESGKVRPNLAYLITE